MNVRIVAIGLLTREDLTTLGSAFNRAWPVDEAPCFEVFLEAIDKADRRLWRERDEADLAKVGSSVSLIRPLLRQTLKLLRCSKK